MCATPAVAIQKLPYLGERPELQFQEHIAGRSHLPVSAELRGESFESPGIDWSDYRRMKTVERKLAKCRRLETPSWALRNEQLREVVAAYVEARAKGHVRICLGADCRERIASAQKLLNEQARAKRATLVRLCQEYVFLKNRSELSQGEQARKRRLAIEIENTDTQLRVDAKIATIVTAVAYSYYRRGLDSVAIAGELGLKPPHVRVILFRLNKVAYRCVTKERRAAIPAKRGRKRLTAVPAQLRDYGQKHPVRMCTLEKHVRRLEDAAAQNGGTLPPYSWLNKHGFFDSYCVMRRFPEAFAHIERAFVRGQQRYQLLRRRSRDRIFCANAEKQSNDLIR